MIRNMIDWQQRAQRCNWNITHQPSYCKLKLLFNVCSSFSSLSSVFSTTFLNFPTGLFKIHQKSKKGTRRASFNKYGLRTFVTGHTRNFRVRAPTVFHNIFWHFLLIMCNVETFWEKSVQGSHFLTLFLPKGFSPVFFDFFLKYGENVRNSSDKKLARARENFVYC